MTDREVQAISQLRLDGISPMYRYDLTRGYREWTKSRRDPRTRT